MKKIYWIINQLNIDDATISAIEIANRLVQYRSIAIVVLGSNENIESNVSGKIDLIYLDIDKKYLDNDNLSSYFKANKNQLRDKISELTTKNDLVISTSYLSSYIVPKGRRFLYYYTGNKETFLSFKEKQKRKKLRNPDNYVFASFKLKEELEKKKKYRGSYQIYPSPILYPSLDLNRYNTMSYIYNEGDDYLLPITLLSKLKSCNIKLNYYANDAVFKKIMPSIAENGLSKLVNEISEYDISQALRQTDMLILLHNNDALPLLSIEAISQGKPLICYKNEAVAEGMCVLIDDKNIDNSINEIKDIYIKQKRLEKYKQNTFELSSRYSKDMILAKWLDILEIEDNLLHKE